MGIFAGATQGRSCCATRPGLRAPAVRAAFTRAPASTGEWSSKFGAITVVDPAAGDDCDRADPQQEQQQREREHRAQQVGGDHEREAAEDEGRDDRVAERETQRGNASLLAARRVAAAMAAASSTSLMVSATFTA